MAMTIWGLPASGGRYAAIAGLTAFPATLLAFVVYEFIFVDSSRGALLSPSFFRFTVANVRYRWLVVTVSSREWLEGHKAHLEHVENTHMSGNGSGYRGAMHSPNDLEGKAQESRSEVKA